MPPCPACHHEIAAERLLANCTEYWPHLRAGLFTCPDCHASGDVRIQSGRLWFGYIYGAGTAHFSAEEEHAVPGLLVWIEQDHVTATLANRQFRIPVRPPA